MVFVSDQTQKQEMLAAINLKMVSVLNAQLDTILYILPMQPHSVDRSHQHVLILILNVRYVEVATLDTP